MKLQQWTNHTLVCSGAVSFASCRIQNAEQCLPSPHARTPQPETSARDLSLQSRRLFRIVKDRGAPPTPPPPPCHKDCHNCPGNQVRNHTSRSSGRSATEALGTAFTEGTSAQGHHRRNHRHHHHHHRYYRVVQQPLCALSKTKRCLPQAKLSPASGGKSEGASHEAHAAAAAAADAAADAVAAAQTFPRHAAAKESVAENQAIAQAARGGKRFTCSCKTARGSEARASCCCCRCCCII
jgi:hypothetical protein